MSRERELLEELSTKDMVSYYYPELINRIKELLAEPEPEPVVWQIVKKVGHKPPLVDYLYSKPREEVYENYKVTELYKRMG